MAGRVQYRKVMKYLVTATCTEPLHIGSSAGEKEEVLIHPVANVPFLQATGIAGVFRSYYEKIYGRDEADTLFGTGYAQKNGGKQESRIRFSDGMFEQPVLERRPRVKINRDTGTCDTSAIRGTDNTAGHRFTTEYVGAGAKVSFAVYLYDEGKQANLETVFSALHKGGLQLGGQKSNGCGYLSLDSLYGICFDLTDADGRMRWAEEEELSLEEYKNLTEEIREKSITAEGYEITVTGKTEGALLVKSIAVEFTGDGTAYSENIKNAKKEYIVPGSSFKGAVRSQMERIARYLSMEAVIEEAFGKGGNRTERGKAGCLYFYDTVIGTKKENDAVTLSRRIHIEKFTGGVSHGGLFSERNVFGEVVFCISVKDGKHRDRICGILLMALRDLAIGTMSVGSGYNVGKGFFKDSEITIEDRKEHTRAVLNFQTGEIADENEIVSRCMGAISGTEEKDGI